MREATFSSMPDIGSQESCWTRYCGSNEEETIELREKSDNDAMGDNQLGSLKYKVKKVITDNPKTAAALTVGILAAVVAIIYHVPMNNNSKEMVNVCIDACSKALELGYEAYPDAIRRCNNIIEQCTHSYFGGVSETSLSAIKFVVKAMNDSYITWHNNCNNTSAS